MTNHVVNPPHYAPQKAGSPIVQVTGLIRHLEKKLAKRHLDQ